MFTALDRRHKIGVTDLHTACRATYSLQEKESFSTRTGD